MNPWVHFGQGKYPILAIMCLFKHVTHLNSCKYFPQDYQNKKLPTYFVCPTETMTIGHWVEKSCMLLYKCFMFCGDPGSLGQDAREAVLLKVGDNICVRTQKKLIRQLNLNLLLLHKKTKKKIRKKWQTRRVLGGGHMLPRNPYWGEQESNPTKFLPVSRGKYRRNIGCLCIVCWWHNFLLTYLFSSVTGHITKAFP